MAMPIHWQGNISVKIDTSFWVFLIVLVLCLAALFYFGVYKKAAPKPLEETLSQKLSRFPA